MSENLPEPESREETYLAKAAGMEVGTLPTPESRKELYLNAIAEGGGGGGTSDFNELSNRPKYNGAAMTGETNIPLAPTVVQTTGNSTTDAMSQDATTKMVFNDTAGTKVRIGSGAVTSGYGYEVAIGSNAKSTGTNDISIGSSAKSSGGYGVAIGGNAESRAQGGIGIGSLAVAYYKGAVAIGGDGNSTAASRANNIGSIAIGAGSSTAYAGEFNIGDRTSTYGYNNSAYRLLTGLYDPQSAHDAATKGYVDTKLGNLTLVSISQTDYDNLATKDPNTLYIITGA